MKRAGKTLSFPWLFIYRLFNRTVPLWENSCKRNYFIDGKQTMGNFDTPDLQRFWWMQKSHRLKKLLLNLLQTSKNNNMSNKTKQGLLNVKKSKQSEFEVMSRSELKFLSIPFFGTPWIKTQKQKKTIALSSNRLIWILQPSFKTFRRVIKFDWLMS